MRRRDALKTMGALAGAGAAAKFLPGCGGGGDDGPVGITNVVVLMMENRSYDHVLGARGLIEGKPGNGLTAGMSNPTTGGQDIAIWPATPTTLEVPDPGHQWSAAHNQWNNGAMDGFIRDYDDGQGPGGTAVMQYLLREHQPVTWSLADNYTTCDAWFCALLGPTWPNRMYWHTGTSAGYMDNVIPPGGFTWPHLYDRLDARGVDWAYYYGDIPVISVAPTVNLDKVQRWEEFFRAAEAGTLPPVVYLDPSFSFNDDHPPHHPMFGQQLIASIYAALASSPQWKNLLFVITYDEHGGFFDHVAPPTAPDDNAAAGFDQLGVRVPAVVIGPYVKTGHVSSVVYNHTSVLKHLENMFGLDPLTMRSSAATDLTDCIDQTRLAAGDWAPPAEVPAVEMTAARVEAAVARASDKDHMLLQWFESQKHLFPKRLDQRPHLRDYAYLIGDALDRYGAGRIVR